MKIPYTEDEINEACYEAAEVQGIKDGYVRPVAFRGSEMMAVSAQQTKIHVAIAVWQWPSYFDPEEKLKGIRLDICRMEAARARHRADPGQGGGPLHDLHHVQARGRSQGLCRRADVRLSRLVAEATGANIFFVKDGQLHTPTPDCFLDGITRQSVIALAKARQIPVHERAIKPEEMTGFEECFLTGTAAEVTPVSEIGPYRFKPGKITETLMNDFTAEVKRPQPGDAPRTALNASA